MHPKSRPRPDPPKNDDDDQTRARFKQFQKELLDFLPYNHRGLISQRLEVQDQTKWMVFRMYPFLKDSLKPTTQTKFGFNWDFPGINGNWMLLFKDTEDIHVKVIDWGLGFYFKRAHMKTSVGTSAYAAPEVQRPVPWELIVIAKLLRRRFDDK